MRFGSAFEITARAGISSPLASNAPRTRPSSTVIWETSAPVRISAPASVAALAMASGSAPAPPLTNTAQPAGLESSAARATSVAVEPAERGARKFPNIPRAAITARTGSVSNHSMTRSATGLGPQASRRCMSFSPKLRRSLAAPSMFQTSPTGASTAGGGSTIKRRMTFASRPSTV